MTASEKRIYSRDALQWPIMFSQDPAEGYQEAYMYNTGGGGLYFESPSALQPDANLYIRMNDFQSKNGNGAFQAWIGKVRWCKKIQESFNRSYGVGVEYTIGGKVVPEVTVEKRFCDMCGEPVMHEMHSTESGLCLCKDCFQKIGDCGKGCLCETLLRFTMGNVC